MCDCAHSDTFSEENVSENETFLETEELLSVRNLYYFRSQTLTVVWLFPLVVFTLSLSVKLSKRSLFWMLPQENVD